MPCARIADGLGWPELPEVTRQAYFAELPLLSESDVLRARAAVMGKPDVRDPWAYLFAILRRQSPRSGSHSALTGATEDVDPFAPYADGEVVTFDD